MPIKTRHLKIYTMIQRIQTVYLLGIAGIIFVCFYFPMAEFSNISGPADWYLLSGLRNSKAGEGFSSVITFLSGLAVGVSISNIFVFKNRKRQMLFCLVLIGILVLINALTFIQIAMLKSELNMLVGLKVPSVFPLIGAVVAFMAYRAIRKDEDLVRSYDRLR